MSNKSSIIDNSQLWAPIIKNVPILNLGHNIYIKQLHVSFKNYVDP